MNKKFISDNFRVPEKLETNKFRLRMLSTEDVEKDYEAVMSSKEYLRATYAEEGEIDAWPKDDMTIEEDLEDLKRHQAEFLERKAFTYTVMNLDESLCLGCVYIYPCEKADYDAEIYMWVRYSEVENGLDEILFSSVKTWIEKYWSFKKVAYPIREISINEWKSLPKKSL